MRKFVTIISRFDRKEAKVLAKVTSERAIITRKQADSAAGRAGLIKGDYWFEAKLPFRPFDLVILD